MKYLIILLLASFCSAQTPVKPIFMESSTIPGAYYKDLDNDFDNFTGTWKYINGSDTLTVVLQKKIQLHNTENGTYEDGMVGEYRYVDNGVEKINTLSNLAVNHSHLYSYNIAGSAIIRKEAAPVCTDCAVGQRRIVLNFSDPTRPGTMEGLSANAYVRRVDEGGTQKIEFWIKKEGSLIVEPGTNPGPEQYHFNVPWGKYTMNKIQ